VSAVTPSSTLTSSPPAAVQDPWEERFLGLTRAVWLRIGVLAVLFAILFWPNLWRLWKKTNPISGDGNWAHAMAVPLIGLYYLYINGEELLKRRVHPVLVSDFSRQRLVSAAWFVGAGLVIWLLSTPVGSMLAGQTAVVAAFGAALVIWGVLAAALNWGVGTLIFGLAVYAYGIYPGFNDYAKDVGMVLTLFGLVLALCGWDVMKIAWFPIAFLICALPWPGLVYSWVASPLQRIAARVAVEVLQISGVESYVAGTKIFMVGEDNAWRALNVAEACAGLRSLMTFITFGAAVGFLSSRPLWQKLFITFSAIPIAIFCNTVRVSGQGLLDYYFGHQVSENFAHQFVGLVMLIPAFLLLLLVGWILDHLFIEEVDDKQKLIAAAAVQPGVIAVPPAGATAAVRQPARTPPPAGTPARRPVAVPTPPPPAGGSLHRRQAPKPPTPPPAKE